MEIYPFYTKVFFFHRMSKFVIELLSIPRPKKKHLISRSKYDLFITWKPSFKSCLSAVSNPLG